MISQTLRKTTDARVGLFLSPHLLDVRERAQINGQRIPEADLERLLAHVFTTAGDRYEMSYFVSMMCVAFLWFAEQDVDYVVCEVGL